MDAVKQPIRAPSIKRGEKIIIDANAGSGKTTTLIRAMTVAAFEWGVRVKYLLAVTFSKAMAGELTGSLAERGLSGVSTSTLHALCRRLIKEDPQRFGFSANPKVLNLEASYLQRQYQQYFDSPPPIPSGLLVRAFHARYQQDIRVGEFLGNKGISQAKIERVIAFFKDYVKTKQQEGKIGFFDMITLVHKQLKADADYLAALVSRFQLLAVDEYQDLNAQERALVQLLAKHIETVLIAGDDLQAIHVYRGASTTALEELEEQLPDARVISLKQSWRLTHENAAFVNAVLKYHGQAKRITGTGHGPKPQVIATNSRHSQYRSATQTIKRLLTEGVQPEEIAVLARYNKSTLTLARYLEREGIPFILTHDLDRRHKLLLRFRRFLGAVLLVKTPEALRILLQMEARLDEDTAAELTDLTRQIPAQRLGLTNMELKIARKFRQTVAITRATPRVDRALHVFATYFQGRQDRFNLTPIQHVLRLEGIAFDATTTLQELHDRVEQRLSQQDQETQDSPPPKQGSNLSTIHAAKGGEWRHVLVLDIYDENLSRNGELEVDEESEFRVFHVALTRVKHQIYLFMLKHEAAVDALSINRAGQPNVIDIAAVLKHRYSTLRFLPRYQDVKDLCSYQRTKSIKLDQIDTLSRPKRAAAAASTRNHTSYT